MTTLTRSEKMLFALLRQALQTTPPERALFAGATVDEWRTCRNLSVRQGVMALAWDGVATLPADLQPPRPLKLAWAVAVERYTARYHRYCRTVSELAASYAEHGIRTIQLKGVGLSTCYPRPERREGGDIDIYACSADPTRMSDAEANCLADELMRRQGIDVETAHSAKHSEFFYKGIPVENHRTFLDVNDSRMAAAMERILHCELHPQQVALPVKGCHVWIPSPAFNRLFVAFHAIQHYGAGLALHHLCDWACLLNRYGLELPPEVTDRRFLQAVAALTLLANRLLGTQAPLPVAGVEPLAERMLQEMLHPRYVNEVPVRSYTGVFLYKLRRLVYRQRLRSEVLDETIAGTVVRSLRSVVRHPKNLFKS